MISIQMDILEREKKKGKVKEEVEQQCQPCFSHLLLPIHWAAPNPKLQHFLRCSDVKIVCCWFVGFSNVLIVCIAVWLTFDNPFPKRFLYGFPFLENCINFSVKSIGVWGEMWGRGGGGEYWISVAIPTHPTCLWLPLEIAKIAFNFYQSCQKENPVARNWNV